jgi:hypothetical protein
VPSIGPYEWLLFQLCTAKADWFDAIYMICSLWRVFKGCHYDQYKLYCVSTFHFANYAVIWISLIIGRELPFCCIFRYGLRFISLDRFVTFLVLGRGMWRLPRFRWF